MPILQNPQGNRYPLFPRSSEGQGSFLRGHRMRARGMENTRDIADTPQTTKEARQTGAGLDGFRLILN